MTEVDLIPDEFKISHQRHRRMRYWLVLILIVFCTAGMVSGGKYLICLREGQTAQKIAREHEEIKKDIEFLNREKKQLDNWRSQVVLLSELGQYIDFVAVTSFLSRNTPDLIYLETMNFISLDPVSSGSAAESNPLPKSAQMFILKQTSAAAISQASINSVNMTLKGQTLFK